jgi:putative membrane protein
MMTGLGFSFGSIGLIIMVLFLGVIIAGAVWLIRLVVNSSQGTPTTPAGRESNALELLNQRYARGEITREQYQLIKEDLR